MIYKNSKKQGDAGVGQAIAYFTQLGYTVLFPLSDSQDYDLAIDMGNGKIRTVQVKTGRTVSRDNTPIIALRTLGGNRSWSGKIKSVIDTSVDYLFCHHLTGGNYLIPLAELRVKSTLALGKDAEKFKLYSSVI